MVSPTSESPHLVGGRGMTTDVVAPEVTANIAVATPTDRVRWGPIIAGLFAALSTLVVLGALGVAVAGTAYDPGDAARNFGMGAGIWAAASMLIAFFVGGLIAARTAAVRGHGNGAFQGAMVWMVAIPLLVYVVSSVATRAARTAGAMANSAAQTVTQGAAAASNTPQGQQAAGEAQNALPSADQAKQKAQEAGQQIQQAAQNPQNQEKVADATAKTGWGTLASLLLGLAAATVGGLVGARSLDRFPHGGRHGHTHAA